MSLRLTLVPTEGGLIAALQAALLEPPDCDEFAADHQLDSKTMPSWSLVNVLNALVGALDTKLTLLAIAGTDPGGVAQEPLDEEEFNEAVLTELAAIVDEPNPLTNETVLDYLVAAYNAARTCCDLGLFICASDEERLAFWPIVQAWALWLVDIIAPEPPEDDDKDVAPD